MCDLLQAVSLSKKEHEGGQNVTDPPHLMNGMNLAHSCARRTRSVRHETGLICLKQREMQMNATGRRVLTSLSIMAPQVKSAYRGQFRAAMFQANFAQHKQATEGGRS